MAKPTILGVRTVARSRLFHIRAVRLRFGNGAEVEFEHLASPPDEVSVLIVAMPDPAHVLLIREYAVAVDRYELGLPSGRIEVGEVLFEAANRELQEETGFAAAQFRHAQTLTLGPAFFDGTAQVVLATDLSESRRHGDEPERMEVVSWPLANLDHFETWAEISDARTLAALFIVRSLLASEWNTGG